MKVLVCDDDALVLVLVKNKLAYLGVTELVMAENGRQAINMLSKTNFDLIITDIHMPYFNGMEVIIHLRQVLKQTTPVIVISVDGLQETVGKALALGANDFLLKPFSANDLCTRVNTYLNP